MKKGTSIASAAAATTAGGAGGKKNAATTTASATTATSTVPPKKAKYNNNEATAKATATSTLNRSSSSILPKSTNGVDIQFTFGTLPTITSVITRNSTSTTTSSTDYYKATILICHRKTLHQMVMNGGNELLNTMLHINISNHTVQSMYTDCGGSSSGSSSSSSGTSVVSTYIDTDSTSTTKDQHHHHSHKLYIIAIPDSVSRNNHSWSIHSITDGMKQSCNPRKPLHHVRVVFCGPMIDKMIGSLSCAVARAFSIYTRKSLSSLSVPSLSSQQQQVHISFMDVSENGIHEYLPSSSSSSGKKDDNEQQQYSNLSSLCSNIQYAAQLVDMVRFSILSSISVYPSLALSLFLWYSCHQQSKL
jgi:hypothetical protein